MRITLLFIVVLLMSSCGGGGGASSGSGVERPNKITLEGLRRSPEGRRIKVKIPSAPYKGSIYCEYYDANKKTLYKQTFQFVVVTGRANTEDWLQLNNVDAFAIKSVDCWYLDDPL